MSNDKLPDEIELKKDFEKFLALREKINSQIEYFNKNANPETIDKIKKIKEEFSGLSEKEKKEKICKKVNESSFYHRFLNAAQKDLDIDPSRLMGLTDGIFGMVMTLLVFGMALPESIIVNYTGFISFVYSLIPTIGIVIVAFVLISSFWVYHHEFIKVKSLNIPYLWLNIFYLASISFIPFTTSIIGLYSHFFLAEVIFGINIMLTIILFLIMFHYADKRNFLANNPSKEEKKYIYDTFFIIVALTFCVNLLDFNVSKNFIYLFLLVPVISTIRDINFKIKS